MGMQYPTHIFCSDNDVRMKKLDLYFIIYHILCLRLAILTPFGHSGASQWTDDERTLQEFTI